MNTPCTLFDFECPAREKLPPMVYDYFAGGAGDQQFPLKRLTDGRGSKDCN